MDLNEFQIHVNWEIVTIKYLVFFFHYSTIDMNKSQYKFQIGKGVRQGCILSPCSFNLYAEYIVRNAGLNEAQVGIKIAGRN